VTFVSIEGLNGVGKSELVDLVSAELGFVRFDPPAWLYEADASMNSAEDLDARYLLFMSAMVYASNRIRKISTSGRRVVVSGYYRRTKAYHRGMGSRVEFRVCHAFFEPAVCVLLTCDEDERVRRLRCRGRLRSIWDDLAQEHIDEIGALYASSGFPTVDTTYLTTREVFERVRGVIEQATVGQP
jgi:thymidylate kinase